MQVVIQSFPRSPRRFNRPVRVSVLTSSLRRASSSVLSFISERGALSARRLFHFPRQGEIRISQVDHKSLVR